MQVYEVGKPFPGPVPQNDGCHFEIGPDGDMVLLIQFRRPSGPELEALKAGFKSYSYYEHSSSLACWVFKYPAPVSYMDAPFHAGLYADQRIQKMIDDKGNALTVYVLDGEIIQSIRYVGLHPKAVEAFRTTIAMQLQSQMSRVTYNVAVDDLYQLTSREIYDRGLIFSHVETKQ